MHGVYTLCKISTTSNQYRFYEAGGAPQWTDTACALLSHLTYRDRRRGPRSTRPLGKRGLHPRHSLTAPTYIRYSIRRNEIGRLRGQQNLPHLAVSLRATLANRGRKTQSVPPLLFTGRTNRNFQINTSEFLLLAIYTRVSLYI